MSVSTEKQPSSRGASLLTCPAGIAPSTSSLTHPADLLRTPRAANRHPLAPAQPRQALLVLAHLHNTNTDTRLSRPGPGAAWATAYRSIREAPDLLAGHAPSLDRAVHRA